MVRELAVIASAIGAHVTTAVTTLRFQDLTESAHMKSNRKSAAVGRDVSPIRWMSDASRATAGRDLGVALFVAFALKGLVTGALLAFAFVEFTGG